MKKILSVLMIFSLLFMVSCDSWKDITASIIAGGVTTVIAPPEACTFDEANAIREDLRARFLNSSLLSKKKVKKAYNDKGFGSNLCIAIISTTLDVGTITFPPLYKCAGDFVGGGINELAAKACSKIKI